MKIVVNKCFGGFGLSQKAVEYYLKLKGLPCFFYKQTKYRFSDGKDLYEKVEGDVADDLFCPYTSTIDLGESFSEWPKDNEGYFYYRDIERTDPLLIKTIEDLGEDVASARLSSLRILEIPDDVSYEIDEYGGIESIHETHRSW